MLFCIAYFTVEIVLTSVCKPNYFLSFFFYLDVLATASLLLDIHEARGGPCTPGAAVSRFSPRWLAVAAACAGGFLTIVSAPRISGAARCSTR